MSDSKLKKDFSDAVRTMGRRTASGLRGALSRMRLWQKAGLLLCLLSWIASAVIGAVCARITGRMIDQTGADRWMASGGTAQISGFFSDGAAFSEETINAIQGILMTQLTQDAIGLSETQVANGAKLVDLCYSGIGTAEMVRDEEAVTVTAVGVGGDFFNFHPLKLMTGFYFSDDDLMQDRVLLDDNTAWRLFGSPYVVGESIRIGGTPHLIAGVFRRPEGRFYKAAGMGDYLVYMSFESLCRYTESGVPAVDDAGARPDEEDDDSGTMEAGLPLRASEIPSTAGYIPSGRFSGPVAAADDGLDSDGGPDIGSGGEDYTPLTTGGTERDRDGSDGSDGSAGEGEQANRNRITCCEAFLPNPVSSFALRRFRGALVDAGVPSDQSTIVDNTARFGTMRLASMVFQPGIRSMQTVAIRYPYWENVALAWEDVLIPVAFIQLFLRWWQFVFLLYLVLWYAINKSWTAGDVVRYVQDRLYDRQSERIYGKRPAGALPGGDAGGGAAGALPGESADEDPAAAMPDGYKTDGSPAAPPGVREDAGSAAGLPAVNAGETPEELPPV